MTPTERSGMAGWSRSVRITLAIIVLCTLPIAAAVVVGVTRKGEEPNRQGADTAVEVDEEAAGDGNREAALLALGVVGLVVAGCVATPFIVARRRRDRDPVSVEVP